MCISKRPAADTSLTWHLGALAFHFLHFEESPIGKDSRALIGVIGQRTRVYEVMQGKRPLSLNMIRDLHDKLGIPANILVQPVRKQRKTVERRTPRNLGRIK